MAKQGVGFQSAFALCPLPMLIADDGGTVLEVNDAARRVFVGTPAASVELIRIADDRAAESGLVRLPGGDSIRADVVELDGSQTLWVIRLLPVLGAPQKQIDEVRGRCCDAEQRAAQLEELLETSTDFVALSGMDGQLSYINAAGRALAGLPPDGPLGALGIVDLLPDEEISRFSDEIMPALTGSGRWRGEVRLRDRMTGTGELLDVEAFVVRDSGAAAALAAVARPIGQRRALEDRLRHAQRLEALGRLAGGVAHDFNNLLTVIGGFASLISNRLAPEDPSFDDVQQIAHASDRAASITRQLLAFSSKTLLAPRPLDVCVCIRAMERIIRRLVGEHVTVVLRLASDVQAVKVDPAQFEQVVLNLAVNAGDAMPAGGTLTIEAANANLAGDRDGLGDEDFVVVTVADTGHGMSEAVKARAFEPFFTSKGPGRGTGLGLATVHGIVEQNGGRVRLSSEEGRGTRVEVYMPVTREPVVEVTPAPKEVRRRGSATVLLVEDEEVVRFFVRTALQRSGHRVLDARDGEQAMRIAEAHDGPLDLLLVDLVMPGMHGTTVAARLRHLRPNMAVIYMSDYVESDDRGAHGLEDAAALLPKPIAARSLLEAVDEVLDASGRTHLTSSL